MSDELLSRQTTCNFVEEELHEWFSQFLAVWEFITFGLDLPLTPWLSYVAAAQGSGDSMDFSSVDFSLTGKFSAIHPAYPLIDSNFITVHGKDNHKGGAQRHYRFQHSRNLVSQVEQEDTSHSEEKLVVKIEAPELPPIDLKKGRFPYCLVWVPLPVVAWLVPFVGHVGICREDGVIIDFAGRINIDNLAFGSTAKYVRLRLDQCCFPQQSSVHVCKEGSSHSAGGTAVTWDDAVNQTMQGFGKRSYNFFTCNCHSFVANCMNRMAYKGSTRWNLVEVLLLVLVRGTFVNLSGFLRAYVPFVAVMSLGF